MKRFIIIGSGVLFLLILVIIAFATKKKAPLTVSQEPIPQLDSVSAISPVVNDSFIYLDKQGKFHRHTLTSNQDIALGSEAIQLPNKIKWSTDNSYLVGYYGGVESPPSLMLVNSATGKSTHLAGEDITWCDAKTMITATNTDTGYQLLRVSSDGIASNFLSAEGEVQSLSCNPNGTTVAALVLNEDHDGEIPHIDLIDVATHNVKPIVDNVSQLLGWSKGNALSFTKVNEQSVTLSFYDGSETDTTQVIGSNPIWVGNSIVSLKDSTLQMANRTGPGSSLKIRNLKDSTSISAFSSAGQDAVLILANSVPAVVKLQ